MASVLIIDDDRDVAKGLSDLLQGVGHFVRTAGAGEEGLRLLRTVQLPDCVLLDFDAPLPADPQAAHRVLLNDASEESVPVVLLSGSADLATIAAGIGTPYSLAKPVDGQALLELIDRALRERTAPALAGVQRVAGVPATGRASASTQRGLTDDSLREERDRADAARHQQRTATEHEADEVVSLARRRADAVLLYTRQEAVLRRELHPLTEEALAQSRREGRAADVVTISERATADARLRHERSRNLRILDDFLEAERMLTDFSLEDERLHSDISVTSRDEFLGMVSHDLRALLHGVALNVSMINKSAPLGEPGATTRKWTTNIQRVIGRMNRLIGDLLDIASIEAGTLRVIPELVDAHQVVSETAEAFEEIAGAKEIIIDFAQGTAAPELLEVRLDHGRIAQVLANLLSNAIKFTQHGGHVVVRVAEVGEKVEFSVADNGPGIPAELLTAIFERYRQIHSDRRGLGLGLYISKGIVEAHGGTIWAESQVGQGCTFHFAIPRQAIPSGVADDEAPSAEP